MRNPDVKKVTGGALPNGSEPAGGGPFLHYHSAGGETGLQKIAFSNALCYTQKSILFNEKIITDTGRKGIPAKECG